MTSSGAFFQSKVARRVFALLVLSALIPLAFLSIFSYRQVTQLLTEQTRRELVAFNASYGTAAYERLLLASRTLDNVAAELARDLPAERLQALSAPIFQSLARVTAHGEWKMVFGDAFRSDELGEAALASLRRGQPLLFKSLRHEDQPREIGIARLLDTGKPHGEWIATQIAPAFLWGKADELPYMTQVCVVDAQTIMLYCSDPGLRRALEANRVSLILRGTQAFLTLNVEGEPHFAVAREVFVASHFGKQHWVVVASRPEAVAHMPVTAFRSIFWGSVALLVLVVVLLSVSQIRRTLVPLERLTAAARRVAQRDFSTPVQVASRDEFGELAATFNAMSQRLDRQFSVLGALSQIDRAILSDLDVAKVVHTVLSRLPATVQAQYGAVFVLDHDSVDQGELHWREAGENPPQTSRTLLPGAVRDQLLKQPAGEWFTGRQAQTLCGALGLPPLDAQQWLALPVVWQNRLCGALLLGWREPAQLDDEDLEHVRDFADRIGVMLFSSAREARLLYQAHYDTLTDLPNRYSFTDRLSQEMALAQRESRKIVLLFIALDRFRNVSDTLGHAAGDALIREAARRLRGRLRRSDRLSRFGGQEFALLLAGDIVPKQADIVAQHVIASLSEPFVIDGAEFFVHASVGIALFPDDGANAADLLRNADTACARASGQSTYVYFAESMNQRAVERASLERDLRRAIAERQLSLFYQPKIEFRSRRIVGAEALMRWHHPQRGMVNPAVFIELAEDTGLIVELGRFALTQGCRQFAAWRDEGIHLDHVAINVSNRQFRSDRMVDEVQVEVAACGLLPGQLELEVTESVMADNLEEVTRMLQLLRQHGARIALDDFGTGYSSMRYLERLPFDTLKIDMSFVRPIQANGEGGAIAAAMVALARSLHKHVVAEGVETEAQAAFLQKQGCPVAQGYLYSKPLPADEFAAHYRAWTPLQ